MCSLKKHDGVSETFVCRDCMVEIDPVGGNYPDWTKEQCDSGVCPKCGGADTAWLFAENCEWDVIVRCSGGKGTIHSTWPTKDEAQDQADYVHGFIRPSVN